MEAIFCAIRDADVEALRACIGGVDCNRSFLEADCRGVPSISPLQLACHQGNKAIVQCILDAGADVNYRNKYNLLAVHYAYDDEIIQLLIDKGADVNEVYQERTALGYHVTHRRIDAARALLKCGAKITNELHLAAIEGQFDICRLLLENGADPNAKFKGSLPVDFAAGCDKPKIVRLLTDAAASKTWRPYTINTDGAKEELLDDPPGFFSCKICMEVSKQPTMLVPCGHTFDYDCIKNEVRCPECRGVVFDRVANLALREAIEAYLTQKE